MNIKSIHKVLLSLNFSGENLVKAKDLIELLDREACVIWSECTITPFYVYNGKRLEIYEYELIVDADCISAGQKNFKEIRDKVSSYATSLQMTNMCKRKCKSNLVLLKKTMSI